MRKLILFAIIVGVFLSIAGFWYWQKNPFSKEILKLEILGPTETEVFKEVEYIVKYKNNGDIRLEQVKLFFEFPENTFLEDGLSEGQKISFEELEDIYPGEEKVLKFKGRFLGKKGDTKTVKVQMTYHPKDLKAFYDSETTFTTIIKSIPLSFDFDLSSKIEKGRDFRFSLNYFSTSDNTINDLGIKIEYPSGFEFLKSNPETLGDNEWEISFLNKAEGGRIDIEGRLSGDFKEKKLFKAILGVWRQDEFIPLKEITKSVEIAKPRLSIFQRINNNDSYVAKSGDTLHYEIFFRNISDEPFKDLFLVVMFESRGFDFNSIKTDNGRFNVGDNSIIWDWRNIDELSFLKEGEEGKIDFWIDIKDWEINNSQDKNFTLKNSVLVSHAKEEFEIKVNSKLDIIQKAYFQDEVFGNSGPIPPTVSQTTTYTIMWQAKNFYNDVENVKIKAILPSRLELTGKIFPEDETSKFTFDRVSREIIWRVGDMEAGQGIINEAPSIAFQVALVPTSNQTGQRASIIGEAKIIGEDQWTERTIEGTSTSIDTSLPDDDSVSSGQGIVR